MRFLRPICLLPLLRKLNRDFQALREFGFSANYTTEDGTALHVACACGQVEAVRYLLEIGVDTDIKNQHGQTVLEMIIDLQEHRRPEIAQFVKNPEGWKECRAIIEGTDRRDSGRETEGSQSDNEREVIWQPLPSQASVQVFPDQRRNNNSIYYPPSISARLRDLSPDDSPETMNSTRSEGPYSTTSINRTWNNSMLDKATKRFPMTSPGQPVNRHQSYHRAGGTLPSTLRHRTRATPNFGEFFCWYFFNCQCIVCSFRSPRRQLCLQLTTTIQWLAQEATQQWPTTGTIRQRPSQLANARPAQFSKHQPIIIVEKATGIQYVAKADK